MNVRRYRSAIILWAGILVIAGFCLYPPRRPYLKYYTRGGGMTIANTQSMVGQYDWVWRPEDIDTYRLVLQCIPVVLVVGGILCAPMLIRRQVK